MKKATRIAGKRLVDNLNSAKNNLRRALDQHDKAIAKGDARAAERAVQRVQEMLGNWRTPPTLDERLQLLAKETESLRGQVPPIRERNPDKSPKITTDIGHDLGIYRINSLSRSKGNENGFISTPYFELALPAAKSSKLPGFLRRCPPHLPLMWELALRVLKDNKAPLFARQSADTVATIFCRLLRDEPELPRRQMEGILAAGTAFERMRVALVQAYAVHGKKGQEKRSSGGRRRADAAKEKTAELQTRMENIMKKEGCNKTKACNLLAPEVALSVEHLLKKLKAPRG